MLGVFRRDIEKPDELVPYLPDSSHIPAFQDGFLEQHFSGIYDQHPVIISFGNYGYIAYSDDKKIDPISRPKLYMKDGIYCIYRGGKKLIGEEGDEANVIISCYKKHLKRNVFTTFNPRPVCHGDCNYILYDSFLGTQVASRSAFVVNRWNEMSVYYGHDSFGFCVVSDDKNIMKRVCGTSVITIPKGEGIKIPVLAEIKEEPKEASPSGGSSSKKGSGEKRNADSLGNINSPKRGR